MINLQSYLTIKYKVKYIRFDDKVIVVSELDLNLDDILKTLSQV